MERAASLAPFPKEFPTPKTSPVWITHKLQYALTGGYYSPRSSGSYTPAQTTTSSGNDSADGFSQVPGPP
jgi:hypothetical protein